MFTVYSWISAEIWETMSSEMGRDKVVKITSLTRRLGCLRHRRWGYCVYFVCGWQTGSWLVCLGLILVTSLVQSCHCCGVFVFCFLLLPNAFHRKHRVEVGEVRGNAIANFLFFLIQMQAIIDANIKYFCYYCKNNSKCPPIFQKHKVIEVSWICIR